MDQSELTTAEKLDKLPWSLVNTVLINVFMQLTFLGSIFILFLDALGLSKTQIGFLLSLLPYTGVFALVIAPIIARVGYKRIFVSFDAIRVIVAAFLLLIPWVAARYDSQTTLTFITVIVILFSTARAVVVTAYYPWAQEYIPDSIRGKYSATNNLVNTLSGFIVVTAAGYLLDLFQSLTGFMILISIGLLFGTASVWSSAQIPGGAPIKTTRSVGRAFLDTIAALRDRGLTFFLIGLGLITLATVPLTSFVPLFMIEIVGLSSGNVVLIQTGMMLGGLVSTYLWGWTADRYGSRPIMLSGIALYALLPIFWMLMPRSSPLSLYAGLGIAFLHGVFDMGWIIGSTRLLYVSIVPPEQRSEYTALYYACVGLFGGTSQLLAAQIVQWGSGLSGQFFILSLDAYTGLFALSIVLSSLSFVVLRGVRADTTVSIEEFAGMFLHGNPFMAMTSLIGYHFAKDESSIVAVTERLGQTHSPLTVDELLEVLTDPRFNVRYEAIVSIARTRRHPRLTQALIEVFNGTELALSNHAAWALGRLGDPTAIPTLRHGLDSKYHSIQASSARAMARLGDSESIPLLLERLRHESDRGVLMAYASALGNLRAHDATPDLLRLLHTTTNEGARREIALSLARLVGEEGHFIHMLREAGTDAGTTTALAVTAFKRKVEKETAVPEPLAASLDESAGALARNNLAEGTKTLAKTIDLLPAEWYQPHTMVILHNCATRLAEFGPDRPEYLLLLLHSLDVGWLGSALDGD